MRRRLLSLPLLFAALTGMQLQPWGPNGNGTLEHADDLRWTFFNDVKIVADNARGIYRATFGTALAKMEGHPLTITGYMLTLEPRTRSRHFLLTRRSTGCPFCPPNEPTEVIEIMTVAPVDYTQQPVTIAGRIHLVADSAQGLFYQMNGAKLQ